MHYNKQELYESAKELVQKHNLIFIEDIVALLPCVKSTFYEYFPADSDETNELKRLINKNKVNLKVGLRRKMYDSDNATDRAMLYKLIGEPEELRRLSNNYNDSDVNGQTITIIHKNDE